MPKKSRIAALLLTALAPLAQANIVTSGDAACNVPLSPATRLFTVEADSVIQCLYTGMGNINGSVQPGEDVMPFHADFLMLDGGWTHVTDTGWLTGTPSGLASGLGGSFAIAESAYDSYERFAVGFKAGRGGMDPDFAIFELAPWTLGGSWSITGQQALSHVILWATGAPVTRNLPTPQDNPGGPATGDATNPNPDPNRVPEPASLALVGLGLLGAAAARRRRQA